METLRSRDRYFLPCFWDSRIRIIYTNTVTHSRRHQQVLGGSAFDGDGDGFHLSSIMNSVTVYKMILQISSTMMMLLPSQRLITCQKYFGTSFLQMRRSMFWSKLLNKSADIKGLLNL